MTAQLIDGKAFAAQVRGQVANMWRAWMQDHGIVPGLAVVLVGEDPASQVYVRSKGKQTVEVGMTSFEHKLDASVSEEELIAVIDQLNADPACMEFWCNCLCPSILNEELVIGCIDSGQRMLMGSISQTSACWARGKNLWCPAPLWGV